MLRSTCMFALMMLSSATSVIAFAAVDTSRDDAPAKFSTVVFSPWLSSREAISRATGAGATIVAMGRLPFVLVVHPNDGDFRLRVRAAGGLMLPQSRLLGCASRSARA